MEGSQVSRDGARYQGMTQIGLSIGLNGVNLYLRERDRFPRRRIKYPRQRYCPGERVMYLRMRGKSLRERVHIPVRRQAYHRDNFVYLRERDMFPRFPR